MCQFFDRPHGFEENKVKLYFPVSVYECQVKDRNSTKNYEEILSKKHMFSKCNSIIDYHRTPSIFIFVDVWVKGI